MDPITREIIEYGGLFEYNVARLQGRATVPPVTAQHAAGAAKRPMTIAEKIFARHWVVDAWRGEFGVPWVEPGDSGFVRDGPAVLARVRLADGGDLLRGEAGERTRSVTDPSSILMFRDHLTYLHEVMPQERVQLGLLDVARQLEG